MAYFSETIRFRTVLASVSRVDSQNESMTPLLPSSRSIGSLRIVSWSAALNPQHKRREACFFYTRFVMLCLPWHYLYFALTRLQRMPTPHWTAHSARVIDALSLALISSDVTPSFPYASLGKIMKPLGNEAMRLSRRFLDVIEIRLGGNHIGVFTKVNSREPLLADYGVCDYIWVRVFRLLNFIASCEQLVIHVKWDRAKMIIFVYSLEVVPCYSSSGIDLEIQCDILCTLCFLFRISGLLSSWIASPVPADFMWVF